VSDEREAAVAALADAKTRNAALKAELSARSDDDPAVLANIQKLCKDGVDGANRWTDAIQLTHTYLTQTKQQPKEDVEKVRSND
jgi:hypothetical protein